MKTIFLSMVMLALNFAASAQDTLVVNNQVPGWLSKQMDKTESLNYRNFTIKGYLNPDDVTYLKSVLSQISDKIRLDLSEVTLVGNTSVNDYEMAEGALSGSYTHLLLPKTLINSTGCLNNVKSADTLTIGGNGTSLLSLYYYEPSSDYTGDRSSNFANIFFREGTETVATGSNSAAIYPHGGNVISTNTKKMVFPSKMKIIALHRFSSWKEYKGYAEEEDFQTDIILPDTLEELYGDCRMVSTKDTLYLPYGLRSYGKKSTGCSGSDASPYCEKDNMVIFFPETVDTINVYSAQGSHLGYGGQYGIKGNVWHIKTKKPAVLEADGINVTKIISKELTIYVPYGFKDVYENTTGWSNATILEDVVPVTGIEIEENSITLDKIGATYQLQARVYPEDASNKEIQWKSSNESVCSISSNGTIVALGEGTSVIIATTSDGGYVAVCTVTVNLSTGIEIVTENEKDENYKIYSIDGSRKSAIQKGLNLIQGKNGKTYKIIVK